MKKLRSIVIFLCFFTLLSCTGKHKKVLYVFNWTDYVSKDLITEFEKQNDCEVVYDTYNSNENMLTKVMHSKASYDIVVPSADHVVIMRDKGLLEKLDKSRLSNFKNLDPDVLKKATAYDPNNDYAVPYFWGTTGLIYNKKYIPESQMKDCSWNVLGDPKFRGKKVVTMLDDVRSVIGTALIFAGYKFNDTSPEALAKARLVVLEWDRNVSQYDSDSFKNEIQDGTTWLAQAYDGDALQIMEQNKDIGFVLPKEGAEFWIDNMVILKASENKDLAYKFMDFMLSAENAKKNAMFVKYATPNKAAFDILPAELKNNPIVYPPKAYLDKCEAARFVGNGIVGMNKIWEEIKNN